jgi:hypothetical protein
MNHNSSFIFYKSIIMKGKVIMKLYKIYLDEGGRKKFAESLLLSPKASSRIECKVCNTNWVDPKFGRPIEIIFTNNNLPDYSMILPEHFVSEKLKEVIENNSLSNCTFEKVITKTIQDLNEEEIQKIKDNGYKVQKLCSTFSSYYAIHLLPGISIHAEMNVTFKRCHNCGRVETSKKFDDEKSEFTFDLLLDSATWEGYDLFTVKEFPNRYICTEKFIEICKKENITGFTFEEVKVK